MGFELDDDELQTTPIAAAQELGGRRVYALVMSAIVPDLAGIELVGDDADAVLVGGCDETVEPNQVFSYMNLARAFDEIQAGADLYCLHKNPWWQTARGPMLDGGAFVAALEYATGVEATVVGKPSAACFAAALAALDAEPELTWMVTRRPRAGRPRRAALRHEDGAAAHGQVPARHARALEHDPGRRAQLDRARARLDRQLAVTRVGVDLIEIERIRRSLERYEGFRDRCFTAGRAGVLRLAAEPGRELRGPLRRQGGGREGARLRRRPRVRLEGHRDRRPAEAVRAALRPASPPWAERVGAGAIDLSMTHSRELASAVCVVADA